jgi:hypothetical protein
MLIDVKFVERSLKSFFCPPKALTKLVVLPVEERWNSSLPSLV